MIAHGADSEEKSKFVPTSLARTDRIWLGRTAARIRVLLRGTVRRLIETGQLLIRVRRRLGRGQFVSWATLELGLSKRTVYRLIAIAKVFNDVPSVVIERFSPVALYTLAQPNVPAPLREYAIEQAKEGVKVDGPTAVKMLAVFHDRGRAPAPLKLASKDPPKVVDPDEVFAAENWRMLVALVASGGTLHVSSIRDAETEDAITAATWLAPDGTRRIVCRDRLESVVLELVGKIREKSCRKCRTVKSLDSFSRRKDSEDGRNKYCLECERKRVAAWTRAGGKQNHNS